MMTVMNLIFQDMLHKDVMIYLDDIIIAHDKEEKHNKALIKILERLKQWRFFLNKKKCIFWAPKLPILGSIISENGIEPEEEKITQVLKFKRPTHQKALKSFLGICNYLQQFCKDLQTVAAPLNDLLNTDIKKNWRHLHEKAFNKCKELINGGAVLKPINKEINEPIWLITDASQTGIGAWIGQGPAEAIRPAGYYSQKLNSTELDYSVPEKEMLGIYKGLQHFDSKLRGTKFTILTDHQAWTHFMKSKPDSKKYRRWQDYSIQL